MVSRLSYILREPQLQSSSEESKREGAESDQCLEVRPDKTGVWMEMGAEGEADGRAELHVRG